METFEQTDHSMPAESICRICLTDSASLYISVHDEILNVKISDLISEISSSKLCLDSRLSSLICTICCKNLQKAIRLRRMFLRSESFLLNLQECSYVDEDPFLGDDLEIVFVDKPTSEECQIDSDVTLKTEMKIEVVEETTVEATAVPEERKVKRQSIHQPVVEKETDKTAVLIISPDRLKLSCCMCYFLAETELELISHLHTHPERARRNEYRLQVDKALPNDRKAGRKICIKCMKAFYARRQLDAHLKAFYLDQKFQCGCCGTRFGFYDKLKEHERRCMRKAGGTNMFQCPTCQKLLTKAALIDHVKIHNMTEVERTRFKCETCQRGYPTKRALKIHVVQHMTIRSKKCHLCQKKFKTSSNLAAHIRVHNNDRIYKCFYCENTYIHASDKNRHEKSAHTGERPHRCEFCGKGFVKKYSLTVHLRTCQSAPHEETEEIVNT